MDKTAHTNVMGKKDLASGEPLALDTIFRIFSMTKPVTGVAMAILHDEGRWRMDDPIAKHLPEFEGVRVFDGLDEAGKPKTVAANHPPTMRELMTHSAGLSYGFNQEDPLDQLYQAAQVWQSASLAEFSGKVAALPLAYQPGSKWPLQHVDGRPGGDDRAADRHERAGLLPHPHLRAAGHGRHRLPHPAGEAGAPRDASIAGRRPRTA